MEELKPDASRVVVTGATATTPGVAPKKKKPLQPIEQGHAREIAALLIWPLVTNKPESYGYAGWLEYVFSTEERPIECYKTVAEFRIPGLEIRHYTKRVAGTLPRRITPGVCLYVRCDLNLPNIIEVETFLGQGQHETHFQLTLEEWRRILPNLIQQPWKERPPRDARRRIIY